MKSSRHRTGRPPLDHQGPSRRISFRTTARKYDDLYHQAQRERVSIGEMIRRCLPKPDEGEDDDDR